MKYEGIEREWYDNVEHLKYVWKVHSISGIWFKDQHPVYGVTGSECSTHTVFKSDCR